MSDYAATAMMSEQERGEFLRLLVESVRDYAIFLLDTTGHIASWNPAAQRFKGYEAHEIIGKHFSVFYPRADVEAGKCEHELEVATREGRFEEEGWRVRKDGTRFWAHVVITALRDPAGTLVGFGKVTRDLTERKHAEDQRRAAEERYRSLVESVRDYAILILDPQGNVATWNAGAERIVGYRAEEIIGAHFSRFYPPEDVRAGKCEYELEGAARDGRFEDEGWRVRKDGTRFWANVVISAVHDANATLVGFSKVTRDLTERRRAEEERAARLVAEEASRAKDDFLAMLGHELRNPLAPIVAALHLLEMREPAATRELQIIERQVKHMTRIVDDLLDVARVTRGKVALDRQPLDLREALAKAIEIATPMYERRGQTFDVQIPAHPLAVRGDEARLVQVFTNLLTNASKYTPEGGTIALAVSQRDTQFVVEVKDNGKGIEASLLPRVFDLFVQGYQESDRAEGGLGLGLTLVRALVEMHEGTVEARSQGVGHGSCFVVRLPAVTTAPLRDSDGLVAAKVAAAAATKRRILLVDDNEDARELLAEMLASYGHEVKTAGNGEDALALLDTFTPQVAILDIGLPGMDGYELASRIRARSEGAEIRLLALSGYAKRTDSPQSQGEFDVHLIKPVDTKRLMTHLAAPV